MELTLVDGRVTAIRDFRYVPYIAHEAAIEFAAGRSNSAAIQGVRT
jgi:hypothetical protein